MVRIFLGMALVGAIFVHSPHRPGVGIGDEVAALAKGASAQLATSVGASGLAPALADAVLRRTITEAMPAPSGPAGVAADAKRGGEPGRR